MADAPQDFLKQRYDSAIEAVKAAFKNDPALTLVATAESLPLLKHCPVVWRKTFHLEGQAWVIDVGLPPHFPDEPPLAALHDWKLLHLRNPHIGENGFVCTIPDSAAINSHDPGALVRYVFDDAEKILIGTGKADFQNEFTSYWNRTATLQGQSVLVIDPADELKSSFPVIFRDGVICVGASVERISKWVSNLSGKPADLKDMGFGVAIHLNAPVLPDKYPNTLADLIALAESADPAAASLLKEDVIKKVTNGVALLIQKEGDGIVLGAVIFSGLNLSGSTAVGLTHGFRPGKVPASLLYGRAKAVIGSAGVKRGVVTRADSRWIHSRGGDGRDLSKKSALLIGCGSLGGYVAHLLSRAGVGHLTMTDNDFLAWENLGRHILGASYVGRSKAEALAEQLARELPHLNIKGIPLDWREAFAQDPTFFAKHDLVISTVADWRCERPLNALAHATHMPPVLLSWLEPHAVAGHCLVIGTTGGCFECAANTYGQFTKAVASFKEPPMSKEPGGCTHYQHYGPSALVPVASMIASVVIDSLLTKPARSSLSTWISGKDHFASVKADVSELWMPEISCSGYSKIFHKSWEKFSGCPVCANANA